MEIIVRQSYKHINSSLPNWDTPTGKYVKNKDHYDRLMKESGMISYEKAKGIANGPKTKEYKLSNTAQDIISAAKNSKDSRGNVKLSDRTIDALIKHGAIGNKSAMEFRNNMIRSGNYK